MSGLHTKSGDYVLKCVKDLVEVQLVQDGLTIKRCHADGAGELIGWHIRKYLHENETVHTTSDEESIMKKLTTYPQKCQISQKMYLVELRHDDGLLHYVTT